MPESCGEPILREELATITRMPNTIQYNSPSFTAYCSKRSRVAKGSIDVLSQARTSWVLPREALAVVPPSPADDICTAEYLK